MEGGREGGIEPTRSCLFVNANLKSLLNAHKYIDSCVFKLFKNIFQRKGYLPQGRSGYKGVLLIPSSPVAPYSSQEMPNPH